MSAHLASVLAAVVVGATLLVSGATKLAAPDWPVQAAALGVARPVALVVPPIELALGASLVAGLLRHVAAWLAVALLGAFSALLAYRLAQGRRPVCACFGRLSRRPIGPLTLVRNAALLGLAVVAALS